MKARRLVASQADRWRNIPISQVIRCWGSFAMLPVINNNFGVARYSTGINTPLNRR
jgi:hypothetical protein